jgi:hypothetical protein
MSHSLVHILCHDSIHRCLRYLFAGCIATKTRSALPDPIGDGGLRHATAEAVCWECVVRCKPRNRTDLRNEKCSKAKSFRERRLGGIVAVSPEEMSVPAFPYRVSPTFPGRVLCVPSRLLHCCPRRSTRVGHRLLRQPSLGRTLFVPARWGRSSCLPRGDQQPLCLSRMVRGPAQLMRGTDM